MAEPMPRQKHQPNSSTLHFGGIGPIYGFVFNVRGVAADRDIVVSTPNPGLSAFMIANTMAPGPHLSGDRTLWFTATVPQDHPTATVKVGIADADWRLQNTFDPVQGQVQASFEMSQPINGVVHPTKEMDIACSPACTIKGKLSYVISDDSPGYSCRLIAIDKHGNTVKADMLKNGGAAALEAMTATFPHLKASDIKELQFEVRPYTWLEFRNIPLRPIG